MPAVMTTQFPQTAARMANITGPVPSQVLEWLFLGNIAHGKRSKTLHQLRINRILNVCMDSNGGEDRPNFITKWIKIDDWAEVDIAAIFEEAHGFLLEARQAWADERTSCLVHCRAGMSRSVTVVLSFLMKYEGMTLREAYFHTKRVRRNIYPNTGFFDVLIALDVELHGATTVTCQEKLIEEYFADEAEFYARQKAAAASGSDGFVPPADVSSESEGGVSESVSVGACVSGSVGGVSESDCGSEDTGTAGVVESEVGVVVDEEEGGGVGVAQAVVTAE